MVKRLILLFSKKKKWYILAIELIEKIQGNCTPQYVHSSIVIEMIQAYADYDCEIRF